MRLLYFSDSDDDEHGQEESWLLHQPQPPDCRDASDKKLMFNLKGGVTVTNESIESMIKLQWDEKMQILNFDRCDDNQDGSVDQDEFCGAMNRMGFDDLESISIFNEFAGSDRLLDRIEWQKFCLHLQIGQSKAIDQIEEECCCQCCICSQNCYWRSRVLAYLCCLPTLGLACLPSMCIKRSVIDKLDDLFVQQVVMGVKVGAVHGQAARESTPCVSKYVDVDLGVFGRSRTMYRYGHGCVWV